MSLDRSVLGHQSCKPNERFALRRFPALWAASMDLPCLAGVVVSLVVIGKSDYFYKFGTGSTRCIIYNNSLSGKLNYFAMLIANKRGLNSKSSLY